MKIILKKIIDEKLEKDWIFLEKNNNFLIYQSYQWNLSWLKENINYYDLLIICVYDDENLVIIFPLCIIKKFKFKVLRWIGYDISDYLGPIISNKHKIEKEKFNDIWISILKLIENQCDLIFLDKQVNENFFPNNLIVKNLECKKYDENFRTNLLKWNEIKKNKSRSLQKIRWAKKKLSEIGELEFFEEIDENNEKKNLIKKIIEWKKEKNENSNFLKSFTERFYSNFSNDEKLIVSGLKLDNDYIALSLGFKSDKNYFYLIPSYKIDQKINKYSPGKILMIELLDHFESKKFEYFDFCDGKEHYKLSWSDNKVNLITYIKPTNLLGLILKFFLNFKK